MHDWNVVISIYQYGFKRAVRALQELGRVDRSPYHNVLVMAAEDPFALLAAIERKTESDPALYDAISRVAPAMRCFEFHSAEEFRQAAKSIVLEWLPRLRGKSFHVRLHRRGLKHDLRSQDIERFLDEALLAVLELAGAPGRISFSDPDMVVVIDTIDERAGVALWSHDDIAQHRLLRPD